MIEPSEQLDKLAKKSDCVLAEKAQKYLTEAKERSRP